MGVPSFYRWLVDRYPKVVESAKEESGDSSNPNPNGFEFDNLYLDMNGIIHPCFHPEDQLFPPTTYDEVFVAIFEYIDRIFRIVRPRKLLYMAIDGVAPRAKMNQQRCRRFKTAKDAEIAEVEEEKLRREYEFHGKEVLPKQHHEVSDSNVITPGTLFMEKLSNALEYYIRARLNKDPGWKMLKVILSDASVPGEGEHKIMAFIRLQRNLLGYDHNTRHCLYGLDADLIMLALATHEIHFSILREDVSMQHSQDVSMAHLEEKFLKSEYEMIKSRAWFGKILAARETKLAKKPYQFLHIWILREYLQMDLITSDPPFEIDLERLVDDFIFMCLFTGNDFLPHIPSIEIHEGVIDLLISVYKAEFKKIGGYLIDASRMNDKKAAYLKVKHVERFILAVAAYEEKILEKRYKIRQQRLQKQLRERIGIMGDEFNNLHIESTECVSSADSDDVIENTKALKQSLKEILRDKNDLFKNGASNSQGVRLGFPGWRERYYKENFHAEGREQIENMRKEMVCRYMEGLCWVLKYYFSGVASWTWFYPFHYGPFASDLKGLSFSSMAFTLGKPFKPFDQLMAVLPPRSVDILPEAYDNLMMNPESAIIAFYPADFDVDTEGKRYMWQGVVKLPFIEEAIMLTETRKLEKELKEDERNRNSVRSEKILVMSSHKFGEEIYSLYCCDRYLAYTERKEIIQIDSIASGGINGFLCCSDVPSASTLFTSPVEGMEDIGEDSVVSAIFKNPAHHGHVPRPLENVDQPEKTITATDLV